MPTKSAFASKGVWGGAAATIAGFVSFFHAVNIVGLAAAIVDNWPAIVSMIGGALAIYGRIKASAMITPPAPAAAAKIAISFALLPALCCGGLTSCTSTQQAEYYKAKAAITASLSTPQAQALENAGKIIAQAAISVYAPEFAWTLPLALNAASGLLADQTTAETIATVQQTVASVSGIPAYHDVATQIGNAIAAVAPVDEAQRMAATQALALAIAHNLPKP